MKYTDGFNKIESPYQSVKAIFDEVFDGEDTTSETFYNGSFEDLITSQSNNYKDMHGVDYEITIKQKEILRRRWIKLKGDEE